jgi:ketosteroid isomerase-like protein
VSEPLEKLRALYAEWARGDFSREIFHDDVTTRMVGWLELSPAIQGKDEVVARMGEWLSAWEHPLVIEADEFIESGDRILALVRWRGRGRGSGVEMEAEGAHIWTLREGLAVRWDVYRDRDEARAAMKETD